MAHTIKAFKKSNRCYRNRGKLSRQIKIIYKERAREIKALNASISFTLNAPSSIHIPST